MSTSTETESEGLPSLEEQLEQDGPVDLPPPDLKKGRLGIFSEIRAVRRHIKKRRKMIRKGYVEWYLVDSSFPRPKYVKPEADGGGIPEYKHNGVRYLFPREAMVANEQNGGWTVVHKKGDAEPINLREPSEHAIPPDILEEYSQLIVTDSPPSLLDRFDLDARDAFLYLIVGIVGFAFIQGMMGGF